MICPVLHNRGDIGLALKYVEKEMRRRNEQMSPFKNLKEYNQHKKKKLPEIVIIVDKYIELQSIPHRQIEDLLKQIASLGRSSGIHLIINSQSPFSEVISGDLKNNLNWVVDNNAPVEYASQLRNVSQFHFLVDNKEFMKRLLQGVANMSRINATQLEEKFEISISEAYEVLDFLLEENLLGSRRGESFAVNNREVNELLSKII